MYVSGNVCAKSTFGVLRDVTQRSASICSIVSERCRAGRGRADLHEDQRDGEGDARHRDEETELVVQESSSSRDRRPCQDSFSRVALEPRIMTSIWACARSRSGPPVHPGVLALGDLQRDHAVDAGPDHLRDEVGVGELGAEAALRRSPRRRDPEERVRVLLGVALLDAAVFRLHVVRVRRHEHQPVVVGVLEAETDVRAAGCAEPLDRDRRSGRSSRNPCASARKSHVAELARAALPCRGSGSRWRWGSTRSCPRCGAS